MNILHIVGSFGPASGGLGPVVIGFSKEQSLLGHNPMIWSLDSFPDAKSVSRANELDIEGIKVFNTFGPRKVGYSPAMERKVMTREESTFDILHQHSLWLAISRVTNCWRSKFSNVLWCLIGDGDDMAKLQTMVADAGLSNHVRFIGELYDEKELAPWFLSSEVFLHPAAIGLSIMHAFGYGLPVMTHGKAEFHNPEYAAFEPELTGRNYDYGKTNHLALTIISLLRDEALRMSMKNNVLHIARKKYNVDVMVERFVEMARKVSSKKLTNHV